MKRMIGLLLLVVFSLMLFSPPVKSLDYDWKNPKYSTDATNRESTGEGHPWGELEALPENGYSNSSEFNILIESVFSYITCLFYSQAYIPPKIIILKKNDLSDHVNNDNESQNVRLNNESTNKKDPYSG